LFTHSDAFRAWRVGGAQDVDGGDRRAQRLPGRGEFDGHHVELLPARTVLSLFSAGGGKGSTAGAGGTSGAGGTGGAGGEGGDASVSHNMVEGDQYNWVFGGDGGAGGPANGGSVSP
jgi:hypothetical protein